MCHGCGYVDIGCTVALMAMMAIYNCLFLYCISIVWLLLVFCIEAFAIYILYISVSCSFSKLICIRNNITILTLPNNSPLFIITQALAPFWSVRYLCRLSCLSQMRQFIEYAIRRLPQVSQLPILSAYIQLGTVICFITLELQAIKYSWKSYVQAIDLDLDSTLYGAFALRQWGL